jgi:hypothetical protein
LATANPGERVAISLDAGKAFLRPTEHEHEWRLAPAVCLTGRESSEGVFLAGARDRWTSGWAAVWQERIGAASVVDTYLMGNAGWKLMTPATDWPLRRAVMLNQVFLVPDVLARTIE